MASSWYKWVEISEDHNASVKFKLEFIYFRILAQWLLLHIWIGQSGDKYKTIGSNLEKSRGTEKRSNQGTLGK